MPILMWFRNDLRVHDNTALHRACREARGDGVVGVFLLAREQWRRHDWGDPKVNFVLRNVQSLAESLAALNIPLLVLDAPTFADAPAVIARTAVERRCRAVYFNDEYEINEARRDQAVGKACAAVGVEAQGFDDQTIIRPDAIRTSSDGFYQVFTPYKRAWLERVGSQMPIAVLPRPRRRDAVGVVRPAQQAWTPIADPLEPKWPAGESEAMRRLNAFAARHIREYARQRDFPDVHGTSELSPYLACGVLSPRQCLHAAIEANEGRLVGGDKSIETWISQIIWREFYRHILVAFPRVCMNQPFKTATRRINWRRDEADFERWCQGRTGVPIVDAAMRQLRATGWMHNRLRMIVAMYLTKDLFIDWQWGERFFNRMLIDADFANNNGGWQWSASTGTDAAPYFRIFNPITQSRRFDPTGAFIRRYLPELAAVDDDAVHDPSGLPGLARTMVDYPPPLVDRSIVRDRVIAAFKA